MPNEDKNKWQKLPKIKFNRKQITRRMRKAEGVTVRHAHKFVIKRWSNVIDVQRHVVMWVVAMGLLIGATGLQLMWNQQSYQTAAAVENSTYAEAVLGPVDTLNPLFANTNAEQSACNLLFSRLMKYDTTGHLGYDLATNVKLSDNNTKYTVTIRSGAKWQDGADLTANDVVYTVNLMKNPNTRSVESGWSGVGVKALNKTTVEFTLQSTYAPFEHALTFSILPEHVLHAVAPANIRENNFSQQPIGSGPYKLNYIQGSTNTTSGIKVVNMSRNDKYYSEVAKVSHFQIHAYDTTDAMVNALSQSEVNASVGLSSVDLPRVDTGRYNIIAQPIQSGVFALINTKSNLLKDINLRKALQLATNVKEILKNLPKGTPALGLPIIPNLLTGDIPESPKFDQAGAKNLLETNGWKLGANGVRSKDGVELKLSVVAVKNSEFERDLEVLAGQWRAVGVSIETKAFDPNDVSQGAVQTILQPRNFDVLLYQLNIGADPDVYAYWHSSQASSTGLNFSNYSNSISDDALLSARTRIEPALRNAKYLTFVRQWLADVPAIGLYQSTLNYVVSHSTHAFNPSNTLVSPIDRYSDIMNWSVGDHAVYKTP